MKQTDWSGVPVSTSVGIPIDTAFALAAVETILKELSGESQGAALALSIRDLHVPLEGLLSVPVSARATAGEARNEWRLRIEAASSPALYPRFDGVLSLIEAAAQGCQLHLAGEYAPPFGAAGRVLDATVLRGAARASLARFLRQIAYRIAAIARWAGHR